MSIQPLTRNHAHDMLPDTAASQAAHGQPVWANRVVRWSCGMPPVGTVSNITWGQPSRLAACLWERRNWCHSQPQDGSPGCARSGEVHWQQPGPPKSPDHLKHPHRGGTFEVKLGSRASWQWSGSGTAGNVTQAEIKVEGLCLKAAPKERRVETHFPQLLPHSDLAQGHTVVLKAGPQSRQPGPGKEVAHRVMTSSVALPLEIGGYKLLCDVALPFWKQVCQCLHCTWTMQHRMYMLMFPILHHAVFESTTGPGLRPCGFVGHKSV